MTIMPFGTLIWRFNRRFFTHRFGRKFIFTIDLILFAVTAIGAASSSKSEWLIFLAICNGTCDRSRRAYRFKF